MPSYLPGQLYPVTESPSFSYKRPSDWLAMPSVPPTEEKFVGLFAVYNTDSNFVAINFTDDYTVDWGDGTVEDFASGVTAEHAYDFASINNSTLTSRGYKQVLVVVTPQSGNSLQDMDINVRHSLCPVTVPDELSTAWLDIVISLPNGESMYLSDGYTHYLGSLEIARIITSGNCTDFVNLFYYCTTLREFTAEELPLVENISSMFEECSALQTVTLPDMPSILTNDYVFYDCNSLVKVTIGDISNSGYIDNLFDALYSLKEVTIGKAPASLYETFEYCYSLESVSILDPSLIEDLTYAFYECPSLQSIYFRTTPLLSDCYEAFAYCYGLKYAKFENLTSLSDASYMFYDCGSLSEVYLPELPAISDATNMFEYCYSIPHITLRPSLPNANLTELFHFCSGMHSVTLLNLADSDLYGSFESCYSLAQVYVGGQPESLQFSFNDCNNLKSAEFEDCSHVVNTTGMFYLSNFLSSLRVPNLASDIDLSNKALSRDAIVQVFNDLATVLTPQYIDVSGNWGAPFLSVQNLAIATDKGWLVTV